MENHESHVNRIRLAEQQFRLACTVHPAVTIKTQPLDVPMEWTFGKHRVSYADFGLRSDQAPEAALALKRSAMYILASTILSVIKAVFPNPKIHSDPRVVSAYQISRMIRNAFSHSTLTPQWSIDPDCRDKTFAIDGVITLNAAELNGQFVDWRHYGGPLEGV